MIVFVLCKVSLSVHNFSTWADGDVSSLSSGRKVCPLHFSAGMTLCLNSLYCFIELIFGSSSECAMIALVASIVFEIISWLPQLACVYGTSWRKCQLLITDVIDSATGQLILGLLCYCL